MFSRLALTSLIALSTPALFAESHLENLDATYEEYWNFTMQESPLWASELGFGERHDRLPDVGPEAKQRQRKKVEELLQRLEKVPVTKLKDQDLINYELFQRELRDQLNEYNFPSDLMPFSPLWSMHTSFAELAELMPMQTEKNYRDYITRVSGFAAYADKHIVQMRQGMKENIMPPQVIFKDYEKTFAELAVKDVKKSSLYTAFEKFPETFSAELKKDLEEKGRQAIESSYFTGVQKLGAFWEKEYYPAMRKTTAIADLPGGKEHYEFLVRKYTTLNKTADDVHKTGLSEVARIKGEMEKVIKSTGFKGDFAKFVQYLRKEKKFYANSKQELMEKTSFYLKRMDGVLPELFKTLPRLPYGIKPVPDYMAPKQTTAYYRPGSVDGRRAGFYFVNTYNLRARPLYEVEALSYHEAVPGHHLQIALQQQLQQFPKFRQNMGFTAFVEGWGLYSESLGKDVGFYEDPYSDFGRLTYEAWRACRLVVDTGLHAFGWSRQQAIDYMKANTGLAEANIEAEVDRYISWPGQALAYKTGQLKILELRENAKKKLAAKFDIREFHDVVLLNGAVSLDVLERNVEAWVKGRE